MKKIAAVLSVVLIFTLLLSGCGNDNKQSASGDDSAAETEFVPKLDTTKEVTLNFGSFFGNFEALIEVLNDFNVYYPNVTLNLQTLKGSDSPTFIEENPNLDIFMTSNAKGYPTENCVDLIAAGVNVGAADEAVIEGNKVNGTLYSLPMSLNLTGLVVNKTLLAKEGLTVPQTWQEFQSALSALKQKGYTPIQGPDSAVSTVCYNMGMSMLANDPALLQAVKDGNENGGAALKIVFERVETLLRDGYVDGEVNAEYPANNYEGSILKFFEGNVPFWVCDTEKVSGMKKRESKSEAFKANPFEYEFIYAPLGEKGAYKYIDPWYGFAVNKDSALKDYAIEFLRFAARGDELNTLAEVKGVPSIAKKTNDKKYANLSGTKAEISVINNGTVPGSYSQTISETVSKMLGGECATADEALRLFFEKCKESSQNG